MARSKKKINIAPEDMDVAKNLGVNTEEKPKIDRGAERKKYRAVREAASIGGALKPEERAATAEKRRYHAALATGSLLSGMTVQEMKDSRVKARETASVAETAKSQQFIESKKPNETIKIGKPGLDESELKALGKKEILERATKKQAFDLPKRGRFEKPLTLGTPEADLTETSFTAEEKASNTARAKKLGAAKKERDNSRAGQDATEDALTAAKQKSLLVGKPKFDPMSASAKLRPADKGLAPSVYDYMDNSAERAAKSLEKARPKIAELTGKAPESISYSGDEPYDVKDAAGNVVATRSVNSHALSLAQKSHRQAKRTGKEVNGIKPTDARPSKVEDILGTPHQAMAYQLRHLPSLTESDVMGAPGLDREKFKVKSEALMSAAVNKAESTRNISVANEVQKGHKGWEDEKGMVHPFVFEKGGRVSPLSLPNDFTRTAQPKVMLHIPDEEDTETSMGAAQVQEKPDTAPQRMSKTGMVAAISSHEPSAVASHEGWTLHDDKIWRKIQHPLANVPESQKMHAADYVAAQASMLVDEKKSAAAKASKAAPIKKAVKGMAAALSKTQDVLTSQKEPYHYATNPRPPKGTGTDMLVRDTGAIGKALKAGKITTSQAEQFSPALRNEANKPTGQLIGTPRAGDFKYLSKEEAKNLKASNPKAHKEYRASVKAHKESENAASLKAQQKALSPRKSFYNRFVDVKPVGKTESSKFTKAKSEVSAGRQWRTVELGETIPTVYNKDNMEGQGLSADQQAAVKDLGTAIVRTKNTFGLTPAQARKKGAVGKRSFQVMADERGPIRDTEVHAHIQHLPERGDVTQAVKTGKIHPEEAKELRTLDQFSKYHAEGVTPGKEGLNEVKYSRLFEPVLAPVKTPSRKGIPIEKLNAAIKPGLRSEESMVKGGPVNEIKEPTGKKAETAVKVSKSMKRVYGEKLEVPKEKPENRGMKGSVKEGRGRQFSNLQGPLNLNAVNPKTKTFAGTTAVHPTLGRGYVAAYHEAGTDMPGTGKVVMRGNATKETKRTGVKKFETPHVTFVPESNPASPVHVPASDF